MKMLLEIYLWTIKNRLNFGIHALLDRRMFNDS